jgi:RNA polymerase sigma-32 factor
LFEDAFAALTPRERQILTERKLVESPKTLAELGVIHGVSRERIRQIEESAFGKLKKAVLGKSARDLFNEPAQTNDELLVAA